MNQNKLQLCRDLKHHGLGAIRTAKDFEREYQRRSRSTTRVPFLVVFVIILGGMFLLYGALRAIDSATGGSMSEQSAP